MYDTDNGAAELFGNQEDLLRELEQNTPDQMLQQRAHERIVMRVRVVVRPGNLSQHDEWTLEGVTGDISRAGLRLLLPRPLLVADIYQVAFDRAGIRLPPQLAICKRCRTIRSDAFESGLAFFQPVDLAGVLPPTD